MRSSTDSEWATRAKNLVKSELKRRGMGYAALVGELEKLGITETERNIANKLSRGTFTAAFMLQCLVAIGASRVDLTE